MRIWTFTTAVACTMFAGALHASPQRVDSKLVSVGLFKNGLAVVKRTVAVSGPGTYEIADVPEPVHGTFWIESNMIVDTRITTRQVEMPLDISEGTDFQRDLAGQKVTIRFRESSIPSVTGVIAKLADEKPIEWNREYAQSSYWNGYGWRGSALPVRGATSSHLILDTDAGRMFIDSSLIATLEGPTKSTISRRRPVLEFTVHPQKQAEPRPATIDISYLAKGMSWAPSYRVDISDSKLLKLAQQAVIRNELGEVENAEVFLISGFPNIEFAHVDSPLAPATTLASFFNQLAQRGGLRHHSRGDIISQNAVSYNEFGPGLRLDLSAQPEGTGIDLHYQSIGARTMQPGDSLMVHVAKGEAEYQRIINWTIPDDRDEYGHRIDEHRRQQEPEKFDDSPFDAVRFRNPLKMPMTTAPAMIVGGGRFFGQRTTFWTNAGEECTIDITKALSIRTRHVELEEQDGREVVAISGVKYWKVPVKGEMTMNNHRNEAVTVSVRRRFSGKLIEADESPKQMLLEQGVYAVNQRNELNWSIELKPGEERTLSYRYEVLWRQ